MVAASASELLDPGARRSLQKLVDISGESVRGRVIVVNRRGRLLADSADSPPGRSYADRPEVAAALHGHGEQITRYSDTLGAEILATSAPVLSHGRPDGAVRITQSVAAVHSAVKTSILDLPPWPASRSCWASGPGPCRPEGSPGRSAASIAPRVASPPVRSTRRSRSRAYRAAFAGSCLQRDDGTDRAPPASQQDFVADASHQLGSRSRGSAAPRGAPRTPRPRVMPRRASSRRRSRRSIGSR